MNKLFAIFLSSLLLSLHVIACSDNFHSKEESLSFNAERNDSSSKEHNDSCSPFCVCNCCKITIETTSKELDFVGIELETSSEQLFPFYEENLYINGIIDIWQPPKLV